MTTPTPSRYKLSLFLVTFVIGLASVILAVLAKDWTGWRIIVGVLVMLISFAAILEIRRGRDRWWLRAPLDGTGPLRGESEEEAP